MKTSLIIVASFVRLYSLRWAADPQLKDQKEKVSYSIGLDIGSTLKRQLIDVNAETVEHGDSGRVERGETAYDGRTNEGNDGCFSKGHDGETSRREERRGREERGRRERSSSPKTRPKKA